MSFAVHVCILMMFDVELSGSLEHSFPHFFCRTRLKALILLVVALACINDVRIVFLFECTSCLVVFSFIRLSLIL